MKHRRLLLLLGIGLVGLAAAAELALIPLRYRTAEELLPLVKPHLTDGASASGSGDRLILRGESNELRRLRALIDDLDRPPRSVLVTVRSASATDAGRTGFELHGGERLGGRVYRSDAASTEANERQIRGLEGRPLRIGTHTLLPVAERIVWHGRTGTLAAERVRLLDLSDGLYALPRLQGGMVEIELAVEGRGDSEPLKTRQVVTTVSGPLGEWIPVASITSGEDRNDHRLVHRSQGARRQADALWLRVDLLDDGR